jgi:hypothetical protein
VVALTKKKTPFRTEGGHNKGDQRKICEETYGTQAVALTSSRSGGHHYFFWCAAVPKTSRPLHWKYPMTSRMKWTVPAVPACTLTVPELSKASGTIALLARVWSLGKLIVLVTGGSWSPG